MSNPIPVLPLEYAHVGHPPRPLGRVRWLALLSWLSCLLAWMLIMAFSVESVIGTGPLIFALGLLMLLAAFAVGAVKYMILAASHCAICLLFFVLVWRLQWSPREATDPFILMGGIYTTISGLATLLIWQSSKLAHPRRATLA
jgi:hypothetical protein